MWVGLLVLRNRRVLMVKEKDDFFVLPGGKLEGNESPEETLKRELKEELLLENVPVTYYSEYTLPSKSDGKQTVFKLFTADFPENFEFQFTDEIQEIKWVNSQYESEGIKVGSITSLALFPDLKKKNEID